MTKRRELGAVEIGGSGCEPKDDRDEIDGIQQPQQFDMPLPTNGAPIPPEELAKLCDEKIASELLKRGTWAICRFLKIRPDTAIRGISAEDIASSAMTAMFAGSRAWGGDLEGTYYFICKSLALHVVAPRKLCIGSFTNCGIDDDAVEGSGLEPSTIEAIIDAEMRATDDARRAHAAARRDTAGERVFTAIADDLELCELESIRIAAGIPVKPNQMAAIMGLPIRKVYELNRKLKRRLKELREELAILHAT